MLRPETAIVKLNSCNTPMKCINSDAPALAIIKKEQGEDKLIDIIMSWVIELNDFLNISRKMNPPQVKQTSVMIMSDFYFMNIADINLVFSRAKKGYYGIMYESLDGSKIYSWFDQYATERAQTAFDDKLNEHSTLKEKRP